VSDSLSLNIFIHFNHRFQKLGSNVTIGFTLINSDIPRFTVLTHSAEWNTLSALIITVFPRVGAIVSFGSS